MIRSAFILAVIAGCGASAIQIQARAANDAALAANSAFPALLASYRDEGLSVVDSAATRAQAQIGLIQVESRWRLVWGVCDDAEAGPAHRCHTGAWPALMEAQDAWAGALERQLQGHPLDAATIAQLALKLKDAYCDLQAAIPSGNVVPSVVRIGCGGAH